MCVAFGLLLSKRGSGDVVEAENRKILIGLSMDETRGPRWKKDQAAFTQRIEELGGEVTVRVADSNDTQQIKDVEALITQGVAAMVIIPHDGAVMAKGVDMAHAEGIPTISYDRLITGTANLDVYATFDNVKVGVLQATYLVETLKAKGIKKPKIVRLLGAKTDNNSFFFKEGQDQVLMPLVAADEIEIIHEDWCDNWEGVNAKRIVNAAITLHGHDIHGILASADVLANGAVKALEEEGLSGKVVVTGQDADLVACQRIVAGTQDQTVYKPLRLLARMVAEMAMKLATGKSLVVPAEIDNKARMIPMAVAEIHNVTKENMMETIIAEHFHSFDEVYKTIPENERPTRP
ncbi:MAG: substrate-binding domain-containing protein [Candidatus Synoicihabitans palmerolidicus]|nr:substrate-binding domain-containing protein [Candidatus Synoicihabitans palmerolidicus]MCC5025376.1 substrate-binding domain-containing protein [Candidatus Synoicihabitans palmerolidicus]